MWPKLKGRIWRLRGVLIAAPTIAGLVVGAGWAGLWQLLEWATLDQLFRLRPPEPPDPRILVVSIDESDISYLAQWPISDAILAKSLLNLKKHQPRAIGLDLYRNLPVEPGHQQLVEVFKSTPNLIGVEKASGETVAPPPTLRELGRVGIADVVLDADGKVRRGLMSVRSKEGETKLSLGALLSLIYLEKEGIALEMVDPKQMHLGLGRAVFIPFTGNDGGYVRANSGGYQILLNYRGEQDRFKTVSLQDILKNRIAPELIRDRIVLIGATGESLNDLFLTPYSGGLFTTPMPTAGVIVHANLVSQILSGALEGRPLLRVWSQSLEWLWIVVWSWIGAILGWGLRSPSDSSENLPFRKKAIPIFLAGGFLIGSCYLAFLKSWWIPLISPLAALAGSALAVTSYYHRQLQLENEKRLAQFLEAMPVAIAVIDINGQPYFLNNRAKEIMGRGSVSNTNAEQLAQGYRTYIAGTDSLYPWEKLPAVRALQGERAEADDIEIQQGDKAIPIEAWATPIYDESGNVAYAIVAFQDIAERKSSEAERLQLTNELLQLNRAYERFIPSQFLDILDKPSIVEVQLGEAVEKEMSILFSDIRHFTSISENMLPEENFQFINSYLSAMEPAILENNGFIDKYIGDAIMALFGGSADDAVMAAISMLQRLHDYNTVKLVPGQTYRMPIKIGIGINTGKLMLGTVGGERRMNGTAIGDAVNLASRIEGLTKNYGVSLLISHQTFSMLENPEYYNMRLIDRVKVKGKSEMVSVFEVFNADSLLVRQGKIETLGIFEQAVLQYNLGNCREAGQLFQDCLRVNPGDKVAVIYLQRCQQ